MGEREMGEPADFTFCQVGSQDDDPLESPKTIPNIKDLSLKDSSSDSISIHDIDVFSHAKSMPDQARLENSGGSSDKLSGMEPSKLKMNERLMQKAEDKSTEKVSQEDKPIQKKPAGRAKVPFEKGYSPMDWLKLTRTHPDLAGLKGRSNRRLISMDEVKQHKSEGSIWTVLKGHVYNISPYMKFHPGGVDMLMKASGKDCTSLFNKYHAWVNAEFLLEKCLVGVLDDSR